MRIVRVAELLANDAGNESMQAWSDLGRQVELAGKTLRGVAPDVVATVVTTLDAYYRELDALGVRDAQVVGPARQSQTRTGAAPVRTTTWRDLVRAPLAASGFALGAALVVYPIEVARAKL